MKILENENLSKYTTFKMGGVAKKLYIPQCIDDVIDLYKNNPKSIEYILGGGSNLLINDKKTFDEVVYLKEFNNKIEVYDNGNFYFGSSVRLQEVIKKINANGYGGIEYLYSVPGFLGGAIYMNAGRGRKHNQSISDYVVKVEYIENGILKCIDKKDCEFSYRNSIFQSKQNVVIVGAYLQFEKMEESVSKERIHERIELCKKKQDMSKPNFGTVFCQSNRYVMAFVKKIKMGYKNGIKYSPKTTNWMLHGDNGTFEQAIKLLKKVKLLHKLLFSKCKIEVKIWE